MNVKNVLVWLCGIWALGIGARSSYCIYTYGSSCVFNYPLFVVLFDFIPLTVLGLSVVSLNLWEYVRDIKDTRLGEVTKNEV